MPETIAAMPETCNWGPCGPGFLGFGLGGLVWGVWFLGFLLRERDGAGCAVCVFGLCAGIRGFGFCAGIHGFVFCAGIHGFVFCAGIRELLARFTRRPCAGRHLLFFAAAKKSRQKKAAHTANISSCLRAPQVLTLHTATFLFTLVANALAMRLTCFTHLRFSTPRQTVPRRPGGKLCVGRSASHASLRTDYARAPPCKSATLYDATTYTQFATWAAHTIRCRWLMYGYSKRVRR